MFGTEDLNKDNSKHRILLERHDPKGSRKLDDDADDDVELIEML